MRVQFKVRIWERAVQGLKGAIKMLWSQHGEDDQVGCLFIALQYAVRQSSTVTLWTALLLPLYIFCNHLRWAVARSELGPPELQPRQPASI